MPLRHISLSDRLIMQIFYLPAFIFPIFLWSFGQKSVTLWRNNALVVELVDTPDLGSGAERRVSSSLIRRTSTM